MIKHELALSDQIGAMIVNPLSPAAEGRTTGRSNVFVIATLYYAAGQAPVRVRNLSPGGALVEGSGLPHPGSRVRLRRGQLQASGEVMWSSNGRAGLRFAGSISVADWLPSAGSPSAQQRVDELVFDVKHGAAAKGEALTADSLCTSGEAALELGLLADGLALLSEQLAEDAHVVECFPDHLQAIEATAQRLNQLARTSLQP